MNPMTNFKSLIKQYQIEIPLLQRDYAQGRDDAKTNSLREKFVATLFGALETESALELDFIYGPVKDKIFIPLDGQQRLTTLFLLHWYIARREGIRNEIKWEQFSYKVRTTTQEFLEELVKNPISLESSPKEEITDAAWYYSAWDVDPSVQGMLVMLDAIHSAYEKVALPEQKQLWANLDKITFQLLEMDNFGMTDDLYMKMNARGKPLTDFENFKAWLTDKCSSIPADTKYFYPKDGKDKDKRKLRWNSKIDREWLDLFWESTQTNTDTSPEKVDGAFLRFFNMVALNRYILNQNNAETEQIEDAATIEKNVKRIHDEDYIPINDYAETFGLIDADTLNDAFQFLDYVKSLQWARLTTQFFQPDQNIFHCLCTEKIRSYDVRLLIFGAFLWLSSSDALEKAGSFDEWMRVVRNLILNTDINASNYAAGVKGLNKLFENAKITKGILPYLASEEATISGFNTTQIAEEKLKAALMSETCGAKWKAPIIEAENHECFRGGIGFLLKKLSNENSLSNLVPNEIDLLEKNYLIAKTIWSDKEADPLLLRAILTLENLSFGENQRKQFNFDKKADNWQKLFKNDTIQNILHRLFKQLDNGSSLKSLIDQTPEEHEFHDFIKDKTLGDKWAHVRIKTAENMRYRQLEIKISPQASTYKKYYSKTMDTLVKQVYTLLKSNGRQVKIIPTWEADWSEKKPFIAESVTVALDYSVVDGEIAHVVFTTNGVDPQIGLRCYQSKHDSITTHCKNRASTTNTLPKGVKTVDFDWWYLYGKPENSSAEQIADQLITIQQWLEGSKQEKDAESI